MDLKEELDALIGAVREQHRQEDQAIMSIASVVHRYALAKSELVQVGAAIDIIRNPPPLQSQPVPPPMPPMATSAHIAEQAVEDEWQQYKSHARTFANGQG